MVTIALIDDDETTNFINKTLILKVVPEASIHVFLNGEQALHFCEKNPPFNYAFLDVNMPVMNGIEFLKKHKLIPKNNQIQRIILFTEHPLEDNFIHENLIYTSIKKPLTKEKINTLIND